MADFTIWPQEKFDGAFCTVDTFRHLLSEEAAISHLVRVAAHLRNNATYVLAMHLLPEQGVTTREVRWQHARGRLRVKTTMTVLGVDETRREENIRITLQASTPKTVKKYRSEYSLRTYTLRQFRDLLDRAGVFEIGACYDHDYDLAKPQSPDPGSEDIVFLLRKSV